MSEFVEMQIVMWLLPTVANLFEKNLVLVVHYEFWFVQNILLLLW